MLTVTVDMLSNFLSTVYCPWPSDTEAKQLGKCSPEPVCCELHLGMPQTLPHPWNQVLIIYSNPRLRDSWQRRNVQRCTCPLPWRSLGETMVSFHSKHTHFPLCEHIGTPPSAKSHQLQPYIDRQTCEAEEQAQQVETGRLCCTRFIWDLLSGTNY